MITVVALWAKSGLRSNLRVSNLQNFPGGVYLSSSLFHFLSPLLSPFHFPLPPFLPSPPLLPFHPPSLHSFFPTPWSPFFIHLLPFVFPSSLFSLSLPQAANIHEDTVRELARHRNRFTEDRKMLADERRVSNTPTIIHILFLPISFDTARGK